MVVRKVDSKHMDTRRTTYNTYRQHNVPPSTSLQPTRLTPQQFHERREKGIFFNCDSMYNEGHKCSEKQFFYIDYNKKEEKQQEPSQYVETKEITYNICLHSLAIFSSTQTFRIEGYIKKKKRNCVDLFWQYP